MFFVVKILNATFTFVAKLVFALSVSESEERISKYSLGDAGICNISP